MNKLIERLRTTRLLSLHNTFALQEEAAKALEAADKMAEASLALATEAYVNMIGGAGHLIDDANFAVSGYRNLTQEARDD